MMKIKKEYVKRNKVKYLMLKKNLNFSNLLFTFLCRSAYRKKGSFKMSVRDLKYDILVDI